MNKLSPEQALKLILDQVDYTVGACRLTDMVGAILDAKIIQTCRESLQASPPSKSVQVIDGGCTTLEGLLDRCDIFKNLHGPGKIENDPRGFVYESLNGYGYRVLVKLTPPPTQWRELPPTKDGLGQNVGAQNVLDSFP